VCFLGVIGEWTWMSSMSNFSLAKFEFMLVYPFSDCLWTAIESLDGSVAVSSSSSLDLGLWCPKLPRQDSSSFLILSYSSLLCDKFLSTISASTSTLIAFSNSSSSFTTRFLVFFYGFAAKIAIVLRLVAATSKNGSASWLLTTLIYGEKPFFILWWVAFLLKVLPPLASYNCSSVKIRSKNGS
jgi:hypothetical protein